MVWNTAENYELLVLIAVGIANPINSVKTQGCKPSEASEA
jgi:hypothetical protein